MKRIFIGIDVSKGHADFTLIDEKQKRVLQSFKLFDNPEGHIALIHVIQEFKKNYPAVTIYCAMESTGRYEKHWNDLLRKFDDLVDRVYIVSGYQVKYHHLSLNEKNKTDAISSFIIAHYLSSHYNDLLFNQSFNSILAKQIVKSIDLIDKSIVAETNRLKMETYIYFPEFSSIIESYLSTWHLTFLQRYPTSYHAKYGKIRTMKEISYADHGKIDIIKNQISMAIRPLGDKCENDSCGKMISDTAKEILSLRLKKEDYLRQLEDISNPKHVQLLKSIPGIGRSWHYRY